MRSKKIETLRQDAAQTLTESWSRPRRWMAVGLGAAAITSLGSTESATSAESNTITSLEAPYDSELEPKYQHLGFSALNYSLLEQAAETVNPPEVLSPPKIPNTWGILSRPKLNVFVKFFDGTNCRETTVSLNAKERVIKNVRIKAFNPRGVRFGKNGQVIKRITTLRPAMENGKGFKTCFTGKTPSANLLITAKNAKSHLYKIRYNRSSEKWRIVSAIPKTPKQAQSILAKKPASR